MVQGEGGMASICWGRTHLTGEERFLLRFPSTLKPLLLLPPFPVAQDMPECLWQCLGATHVSLHGDKDL